jgi:CRP/FNR family transcriptional regulator
MPSESFERYFGDSRALNCEPGTVLLRQGDTGDDILIIRKGQVKLLVRHPDGVEQILRIAGPGETLGLNRGRGRGMPVSAVAMQDVSICRKRLEDVDRLVRTDPDFALAWAHVLADEVDRTREAILFHGPQPAGIRLARLLMRAYRHPPMDDHDKAPGAAFMTHGELASALSLAVETVTRLLHTYEEQKIVRLGRGRIDILDPDRLQAIAGYEVVGETGV